MKALLALEDGTVFTGSSFTGHGETTGEVVFNTSMCGYQEILTDPSYCGQMVTMTYPLIGNYGVNEDDVESERIQVKAMLVKEYQRYPSNFRSQGDISYYLRSGHVLGIEGIDTRALTRHIRVQGAMKAALSTLDLDPVSMLEKARQSPAMAGRDLACKVTCREPMAWINNRLVRIPGGLDEFKWPEGNNTWRVAAIDFGIKLNILRELDKRGCSIILLPAYAESETVKRLKPHGLFLSNGPGDPSAVNYAVKTIRDLVGRMPIFGICLGHQLIGLALGGKTFKLKFGHRGANQPVLNLATGRVEITSQNHGFCVDIESLNDPDIEVSHINLNDRTLEGLLHKKFPLFSVQYHPEASPGPNDATYLFDRFIEMMKQTS